MENSQKALLISAGTLMVLLIISLGIYIYRNSSDTTNTELKLNDIEVKAHNSKYEVFNGIQRGNAVKSVLNYAIQDNTSMGEEARKKETEQWCVNVRSDDKELLQKFANTEIYRGLTSRDHGVRYIENIKKISDVVVSNKKYKVWYSYTKAGYIWEIHIDNVDTK